MPLIPAPRYVPPNVVDVKRRCKIDVDKNQVLSEALRVKTLPTLMIYKQGEMLWRQSGEQDANTLLIKLNEHL